MEKKISFRYDPAIASSYLNYPAKCTVTLNGMKQETYDIEYGYAYLEQTTPATAVAYGGYIQQVRYTDFAGKASVKNYFKYPNTESNYYFVYTALKDNTDRYGNITSYEDHIPLLHYKKVSFWDGSVERKDYNDRGDIVFEQDRDGKMTVCTYTYEAVNSYHARMTKKEEIEILDNTILTLEDGYPVKDENGNPILSDRSASKCTVTTYFYNSDGLLNKAVGAEGTTKYYEYNVYGFIQKEWVADEILNPNSNKVMNYNYYIRLLGSNGESSQVEYGSTIADGYQCVGTITQIRSPEGLRTDIYYDNMGNKEREDMQMESDIRRHRYVYDPAGNLIQEIQPSFYDEAKDDVAWHSFGDWSVAPGWTGETSPSIERAVYGSQAYLKTTGTTARIFQTPITAKEQLHILFKFSTNINSHEKKYFKINTGAVDEQGALLAWDKTGFYAVDINKRLYPTRSSKSVIAGNWYEVHVVLDYKTQKYDIYLNGELIADDFVFNGTMPKEINTFDIVSSRAAAEGSYILIDDFAIYNTGEDALTETFNMGTVGIRTVYNKSRQKEWQIDPLSYETKYTYDQESGNLFREKRPDGSEYVYYYDIMGKKLKTYYRETSADALILLEMFDTHDNQDTSILIPTDQLGNYAYTSEYSPEDGNKIVKKVRKYYARASDGKIDASKYYETIYVYDLDMRLIKTVYSDSSAKKVQYNKNGTIKCEQDQNGAITYQLYDNLNRVTDTWTSHSTTEAGVEKYTHKKSIYNNADQITTEIINKNPVAFDMENPQYVVYTTEMMPAADYVQKIYTYYQNGLLKTESDNEGKQKKYVYDCDGNKTREYTFTTANPISAQYQSTGIPELFTEANLTEYQYNSKIPEKPDKVVQYVQSCDIAKNTSSDAIFQIIKQYEYNKNGDIQKETGTDGIEITYAYDALNRPLSKQEKAYNEYGVSTTAIQSMQYYSNTEAVKELKDANRNITENYYDGRGRMIYTVDAAGGVTFMCYDEMDRMTVKVLPNHYTGDFQGDNTVDLLQNIASDVLNVKTMSRTEYEYDYAGRPTIVKEIYKDALTQNFNTIINNKKYDANGNVLEETDGMGYVKTYTYDNANRIQTLLEPEALDNSAQFSMKYQYDALGRKIQETNADGNSQYYTYNHSEQLLTNKREINGQVVLIQNNTYDLMDILLSQTDANGNVTQFENNALGKPRTITYQGDDTIPTATESYLYDERGNSVKKCVNQDRTELMQYDLQNRLLSTVITEHNTASAITSLTRYDLVGNKRFETDPNGNVKEWTYTKTNQVKTEALQGTNHITSMSYDKNGNVVAETDYLGNEKTKTYDALNRMIQETDYAGIVINRLHYNDNHVQISSIDALGKETVFVYDKNNRLKETTDPLGHTTKQTYNNLGLIEEQYDPNLNKTVYEYDAFGRLIEVIQMSGEEPLSTKYAYDLNGNLKTQTNAAGHTTAYTYNTRNIPVSKVDHEGAGILAKTEAYQYDSLGRLKSKTDRNGTQFIYTYDENGNMETTGYHDKQIVQTYDANGNKRTMADDSGTTVRTYDMLNRVLTKEIEGIGKSVYTYDITGGVPSGHYQEKTIDPKGNTVVKEYDKNKRLVKVYSSESAVPAEYQYNLNGSRKAVVNPDGSSELYEYYDDGTLKKLVNKSKTGVVIDTYAYTYDAAKNQTSKVETVQGVKKGTTLYTYDTLNRLLTVKEPSGRVTAYTYDKAGNRATEKITDGTADVTTAYEYNDQERLMKTTKNTVDTVEIVTYHYDNNGNVYSKIPSVLKKASSDLSQLDIAVLGASAMAMNAAVYEYNEFNQLVKVTDGANVVQNTYNAEGLRTSKNSNGNTLKYVYEHDKIVLELDGANNQTARNVYGTNLLSREMNGEAYTYLYNGHADVTALADENGQITASYYYDAFGVLLEESGKKENPFRYAGEYYDSETGYICLQSRYYVPNTGRFMSEDSHWNTSNMIYGDTPNKITADEEKEDFIPNTTTMMQSCNKYVYCINNPIRYTDPTGYTVAGIYVDAQAAAGLGTFLTYGYYWDDKGNKVWALGVGGQRQFGASASVSLNGMISSTESVYDLKGWGHSTSIGYSFNKIGSPAYVSASASLDSSIESITAKNLTFSAGFGYGASVTSLVASDRWSYTFLISAYDERGNVVQNEYKTKYVDPADDPFLKSLGYRG